MKTISETSVGNMMYLLKAIESVDDEILIYGDDATEMSWLKTDRENAVRAFQKYLEDLNYFK